MSHSSKIMPRGILSRVKAKAEELLAEEQEDVRAGRSTVYQIFYRRVIIERHLQHQRDLIHIFIVFKKTFERVWPVGLWQVFKSFNIEEGLIQAVQAPHEKFGGAVLFNSQVGEFFKTTVGVRCECLL